MRTNFNHVLRFEDELYEKIKSIPIDQFNQLELLKVATYVEIAKNLGIIADTLDNIERRLTLDKNDSDN